MSAPNPESWIQVTDRGLYVAPGDFYVDPTRPVPRAVVTHGHADHARPGHGAVLATAETLAIMRYRYGERAGGAHEAVAYGEKRCIGDVTLRLSPAGHVLGSAQAVLEFAGSRVVVSGDYKRGADPTCAPFEPVACDAFVTEATFGLPVFRHPDPLREAVRLLDARRMFPERAILVGTYALGKAQRLIALLRQAGYDQPVYLHGALMGLCELYRRHGVDLGPLEPATGQAKPALAGEIVLAPPAALNDRWARRLPEPLPCMASGWMRVRQRARQRGVELPLVISDHADWDELTATLEEVAAPKVWVTHGSEEALCHWARGRGFDARALAVVGWGEEDADPEDQGQAAVEGGG
jgi:putative mRNA 3-end processing factor